MPSASLLATLDVDVEEATPSGSEPARQPQNARVSRMDEVCEQKALQQWKPRDKCPNPKPNPNRCPSVVKTQTPLSNVGQIVASRA